MNSRTCTVANKLHLLSSLKFCALGALTCLVAGCGDSKFQFASVEGQVQLDGRPVEGATVVFMPISTRDDGEAGPYSNGETDAEGRYRLATTEERSRNGAVVGSHRVIISTRKSHMDPIEMDLEIIDTPETIPFIYTYYLRTPLRIDVPTEGTNTADFLLESDKAR